MCQDLPQGFARPTYWVVSTSTASTGPPAWRMLQIQDDAATVCVPGGWLLQGEATYGSTASKMVGWLIGWWTGWVVVSLMNFNGCQWPIVDDGGVQHEGFNSFRFPHLRFLLQSGRFTLGVYSVRTVTLDKSRLFSIDFWYDWTDRDGKLSSLLSCDVTLMGLVSLVAPYCLLSLIVGHYQPQLSIPTCFFIVTRPSPLGFRIDTLFKVGSKFHQASLRQVHLCLHWLHWYCSLSLSLVVLM